jgi:hypothetical protein
MRAHGQIVGLLLSIAVSVWGCGEQRSTFAWDSCPGQDDAGSSAFPGNHPPSAPTTRLAPTIVSSVEPLRCVIDRWSTDADGDPISYRFSWLRDGFLTGNKEMIIHGDDTEDGETWTCVVTPFDGKEEGPPGQAAASIGLGRPLPTAPQIVILPELPVTEDDLRCVVEEASVDVHSGEPVTYLFEWFKNGILNQADLSEINSDETEVADVWMCSVIPRGVNDDGPRVTASVIIQAGGSR